ncbi:unnamed protein product [Victoria cruziana]
MPTTSNLVLFLLLRRPNLWPFTKSSAFSVKPPAVTIFPYLVSAGATFASTGAGYGCSLLICSTSELSARVVQTFLAFIADSVNDSDAGGSGTVPGYLLD